MSSPFDQVKIPFFSYWTFKPHTSRQVDTDGSRAAYNLMTAIKNNRTYRGKLAIPTSIDHMLARRHHGDFFDGECIAVPVPGSAPRIKDSLWVPLEICKALREKGLVTDVAECLVRTRPVRKSATAGRGSRCGPLDHFESIGFSSLLDFGDQRVILVDDVITRGATIAGCAARLLSAIPGVNASAFALERTMGLNNFKEPLDPAHGEVTGTTYSCDRSP